MSGHSCARGQDCQHHGPCQLICKQGAPQGPTDWFVASSPYLLPTSPTCSNGPHWFAPVMALSLCCIRLYSWEGGARTVPKLIVTTPGAKPIVVNESSDIVHFADKHRAPGKATLYPEDKAEEIDAWGKLFIWQQFVYLQGLIVRVMFSSWFERLLLGVAEVDACIYV